MRSVWQYAVLFLFIGTILNLKFEFGLTNVCSKNRKNMAYCHTDLILALLLHFNKLFVTQQGKPCPFPMWKMPCWLAEKNPVHFLRGNLCCFEKEILVPSTWISSANIYMLMDLSRQQGFYRPLTEVYPVDAHCRYPYLCWPKFSSRTNFPRITLLDRQNFIRVQVLQLHLYTP